MTPLAQQVHLVLFKLLRSKVPDNECNKHSCHRAVHMLCCTVLAKAQLERQAFWLCH